MNVSRELHMLSSSFASSCNASIGELFRVILDTALAILEADRAGFKRCKVRVRLAARYLVERIRLSWSGQLDAEASRTRELHSSRTSKKSACVTRFLIRTPFSILTSYTFCFYFESCKIWFKILENQKNNFLSFRVF